MYRTLQFLAIVFGLLLVLINGFVGYATGFEWWNGAFILLGVFVLAKGGDLAGGGY